MFMLAMWIMVRDRPHGRRINYYMVVPGCTLLVLATAVGRLLHAGLPGSTGYRSLYCMRQEMGVNIARLYMGFISKGPYLAEGPETYFADATKPTFIVKSCLYNAQTIVLDAVVVSGSPSGASLLGLCSHPWFR